MTPPHRIHRHAPPKAMGFELGGGEFENRVNCQLTEQNPYRIIAELAERSPIIMQNSSNPSSRKNLDVRPYDRTRCYF